MLHENKGPENRTNEVKLCPPLRRPLKHSMNPDVWVHDVPGISRPKTLFRKILVSIKFVSAILGPEMAAPILWAPGKCVLSAGEPMSIKFLVLEGGGILGLGGGECRFYFCGRGDFSDLCLGCFFGPDSSLRGDTSWDPSPVPGSLEVARCQKTGDFLSPLLLVLTRRGKPVLVSMCS